MAGAVEIQGSDFGAAEWRKLLDAPRTGPLGVFIDDAHRLNKTQQDRQSVLKCTLTRYCNPHCDSRRDRHNESTKKIGIRDS